MLGYSTIPNHMIYMIQLDIFSLSPLLNMNMGVRRNRKPCLRDLLLFVYLLMSSGGKADDQNDHEFTVINMKTDSEENSVPSLYVFGDSYVDTGNNNYIWTPFRVNYPPYGQDFPDHQATGRCSNGRLLTDFLASYLGIKELVPPYLDPKLSVEELITGVSFASAGTGYDYLTALRGNLIGMQRQASYFEEYKTKLETAIGKDAAEDVVEDALFFVHCATNDIVNNYFKLPIRPLQYTIEEYLQFLIARIREFLESLLDQGARKLAICGVPPLGCVPTVIDKYSNDASTNRSCIEKVASAATNFNQLLQDELKVLQNKHEDVGAKFIYIDMYEPVMNMIQNSSAYGLVDGSHGCCSSKVLGLCLPSISTVCPNASEYVFWDFIHLTEKASYNVLESFAPSIDLIAS